MISTKGKNIKNVTTIEDKAVIKIEGRNGEEVGIKYSDVVTELQADLAFAPIGTEVPKAFQILPDAANISWDYALGYNAEVTLTASRILDAPTNVADGDYGTLVIIQDGVGSHALTLPASFKVVNGGAGAVTLSTAAASVDSLSWVKKGADFLVTIGLNFS